MKKTIRNLLREGLNFSECGCCEYFDMNSLNDYVEYEKPLYALISKKRIGELKFVKPKQYIYKIAMGFGNLSYEDALSAYRDDIGDKYSKAMANGEKFPIGYYTVNDSKQEGRHRAMAAMKLGCTSIPVMGFQDITYEDAQAYARKFQGKSFEELDSIYKDNGYNGITNLGYNDLQRFIDYNL